MNNPFFSSKENPTSLSSTQKEALSRMQYVVDTNSLGVLTGEVGSGKSTLLRSLAGTLVSNDYQVIYLCNSRMSPKELYAGILRAMGETPAFSAAKIKQQWQQVMEDRTNGQARQIAVLIDEAHDMPGATLLELRFLMTMGISAQPPFAVILAGQAKLRRELNTNLMEPIAQRIRMQYHLTGMTVNESQQVIESQLHEAGSELPVFTEGAVKMIHSITQGIPRLVNQLCGNAYILVTQKGENAVEERHITAIIADLDKQRGFKN